MEIVPKTQPVGYILAQGLPPRALDAGFARGFLVLSIFLRKVCSTAPARWSRLYIRAHLQKVGPDQTKRLLSRADVGPYQAQIRKPSGPACLLPREVGFVQAAVGTCAPACRFL